MQNGHLSRWCWSLVGVNFSSTRNSKHYKFLHAWTQRHLQLLRPNYDYTPSRRTPVPASCSNSREALTTNNSSNTSRHLLGQYTKPRERHGCHHLPHIALRRFRWRIPHPLLYVDTLFARRLIGYSRLYLADNSLRLALWSLDASCGLHSVCFMYQCARCDVDHEAVRHTSVTVLQVQRSIQGLPPHTTSFCRLHTCCPRHCTSHSGLG